MLLLFNIGMLEVNNDIFKIESITNNDGAINAFLSINKDSDIFKGHFPGQPIVPGACMLQIVKDVLEIALDAQLRLKKAGQMKFLNMIDPVSQLSVQLSMSYKLTDDGEIQTTAQIIAKEIVCFKFQGMFIVNS